MKTPEARFLLIFLFTVPDLDIDNDGIHDLSGTTISVSFHELYGICISASESWVVGDDGSVTRESSRVVLPLNCDYRAHFPNTIAEVGGALILVSGNRVPVSAALARVAAVYENAGSTFFS